MNTRRRPSSHQAVDLLERRDSAFASSLETSSSAFASLCCLRFAALRAGSSRAYSEPKRWTFTHGLGSSATVWTRRIFARYVPFLRADHAMQNLPGTSSL